MTRQVMSRDVRLDAVKGMIAFAATGTDSEYARSWAIGRWGAANAPTIIEKADVSAILSEEIDTVATGMIDRQMFAAVREKAVLYRLRGFRRTGFNVRSILTGGTTATWVAPGYPIPVSKPTFDNTGLDPFKICGLAVATLTALQDAPGLEQALFNDLVQAVVDAMDEALLDPTNAGVADGMPGSITNGVTPVTATSDPAADLAALVADFDGDLLSAYFTMTPETAVKLAATGLFRDIGARGGDLLGVPVLTAKTAPADSVALVDPSGVMAAFDEDVLLETGREGSVQMSDAPTNDSVTPTPTNLVSLWQANLAGFRAISRVSWKTARAGSVALLQGGATDWLA